jgi:hypothetical protein
MAVAEHRASLDRLTWEEICARYPNQFVCLVDMVKDAPRSPGIASARVVGHGVTRDVAFEPVRALPVPHPMHAVRFTGECPEPYLRPSLVLDEDALAILSAPFKVLRVDAE